MKQLDFIEAFQKQSLAPWLTRLNTCTTVYVGFSGGLDSTVLLHLLASVPSIAIKLHAVHINHGISPHANTWQRHCEQFCQQLRVSLHCHALSLASDSNLEAQARDSRYQIFARLIQNNDILVLGHHENDQAETLLLHLMRGTGLDGLAAMTAHKPWGKGELLRPLLSLSRENLQTYARIQQLTWVDDESNLQEKYARNFLRHRVIPLLQSYWPAARQSLAKTAQHCQQAKAHLETLAKLDCESLDQVNNPNSSILPMSSLTQLSRERALNVIVAWLKGMNLQRPSSVTMNRIVDELVFARQDAVPMVSWGQVCIRRYQNNLYKVEPLHSFQPELWSTFPGVHALTTSITLHAEPAQQGLVIPAKAQLDIRFRQGGEQLRWHGQTKSLKHLFQEWKIPPWLRQTIPLIYVDDTLAVVVGYAVSDLFYGESAQFSAWRIFLND